MSKVRDSLTNLSVIGELRVRTGATKLALYRVSEETVRLRGTFALCLNYSSLPFSTQAVTDRRSIVNIALFQYNFVEGH